MQLVTLGRQGRATPGVIVADEVLDLPGTADRIPEVTMVPSSVRTILEGGDTTLELVRRIADRVAANEGLADDLRASEVLIPRANASLLAPIPDPSMVLCCSLNYREHLKEMNTPIPEKPAAFVKAIASIVGPGTPILLPKSNAEMVDWEGEFCAVIGKPCYNVSADEALDYVAGYTLINDVSARDWIPVLMNAKGLMGPIHAWEQSILGKQFPTFCPMGPALVTKDEIGDPNSVQLTTKINGVTMQYANTSDLVFGIADLIAHYSKFYRFLPGDVVSTGSPSGVGYGRNPKIFMRDGDLVDVAVDGVGVLSNPVASA
jgi:2-keto-4-pentenoate hydratase/2-oxohepta-3-ene-1,7-dioic acid hydratase in catechol pathway